MGRDLEIRDGKLFFYRPWDVNKEYMKKNTVKIVLKKQNIK